MSKTLFIFVATIATALASHEIALENVKVHRVHHLLYRAQQLADVLCKLASELVEGRYTDQKGDDHLLYSTNNAWQYAGNKKRVGMKDLQEVLKHVHDSVSNGQEIAQQLSSTHSYDMTAAMELYKHSLEGLSNMLSQGQEDLEFVHNELERVSQKLVHRGQEKEERVISIAADAAYHGAKMMGHIQHILEGHDHYEKDELLAPERSLISAFDALREL